MAYIYQADIFCDACGEDIRLRIKEAGNKPKDMGCYDSDEYPKPCSDDEEADTPQHCGSGADCFNADVLPSGEKIGYFFGNALTSDGEQYVLEAHKARPTEVTQVWIDHYGLQEAAAGNEGSCKECGGTMQIDENGISNHVDEFGNIDYDSDADHVAVLDLTPNPE